VYIDDALQTTESKWLLLLSAGVLYVTS